MKLYIAEKPSLARTIAKSLGAQQKNNGYISGNDCVVTWCFGHLYEMYYPDDYDEKYKKWCLEDLPIIPNRYEMKKKKDAEKQITIINKLIHDLENNDTVVNCGDPDREGQLLVDQVIEQSKYGGGVLRAWLKDLTEKGLKKTLQNLENNQKYEPLKNSALARSRADWLVGLNLTRAYTCAAKKYGHQGVLSVGRVQTPTLNMVVERDKQISSFQKQEYYEHIITIVKDDVEFTAKEVTKKIFDKDVALNKSLAKSCIVVSYDDDDKKSSPPMPFTLASLQSECSKLYSYTAQETLDVAQKLYETYKAVSYPRSDCQYLSESEIVDKKELINELISISSAESIRHNDIPKCFNDKKVGAHTAIIPLATEIKNATEKEQNIFELIKTRFVIQFLKPFRYKEVKIVLNCNDIIFTATGKEVVDRGYKKVSESNKEDFKDSKIPPKINVNEKLDIVATKLASKITTPPKYYTEGTLITAMSNVSKHINKGDEKSMLHEVGGIGTEATRAGIIENLKERDFLIVQKKNILSTTKAQKFMLLMESDIKSPILTANWEMKLKKIETENYSIHEYLSMMTAWITKRCKEASNQDMSIIGGKSCPSCQDGYLVNKKGEYGEFKACTNYPICKYIAKKPSRGRKTVKRRAKR